MADRSGYIGRAPGDSTTVISRQLFTASGVTTDFTFSSTYSVGYLDVYVNGVRLIANTDYLAQNGSTFSILNGGADDGDAVEVGSRRGKVVLRASVTKKTSPGVVFIPMHFVEAAANLLTIDALDPQAKIPEFKACAVSIKRVDKELLPDRTVRLDRGRW